MQVKVAEFVGESTRGWQDAIENAVSEASRNLRNISGVEVYNWTASCQDCFRQPKTEPQRSAKMIHFRSSETEPLCS